MGKTLFDRLEDIQISIEQLYKLAENCDALGLNGLNEKLTAIAINIENNIDYFSIEREKDMLHQPCTNLDCDGTFEEFNIYEDIKCNKCGKPTQRYITVVDIETRDE